MYYVEFHRQVSSAPGVTPLWHERPASHSASVFCLALILPAKRCTTQSVKSLSSTSLMFSVTHISFEVLRQRHRALYHRWIRAIHLLRHICTPFPRPPLALTQFFRMSASEPPTLPAPSIKLALDDTLGVLLVGGLLCAIYC